LKQIGRKIFYDVTTGNVLVDTGEMQGYVVDSTIEQTIAAYKILTSYNRSQFDILELSYGQFAHDFASCNGYRVNVITKNLEFSHPDPTEPEAPPVYQEPLAQQIKELKNELAVTQQAVDFLLMGGI
jgi:hypothetical protein